MADAPKTSRTTASVSTFLEQIEDPDRRADCRRVAELMQRATAEAPAMWGTSIVGFGTYELEYSNGRTGEWPIVGFSPRKQDLTLYIMPGFAARDALLAKLGKHRTGKSCLYIKRLDAVDESVLNTLIVESVAAMDSRRIRR